MTKTNLRKDLVTQELKPKNELIRIVKTKEGKIFVDSSKKAPGRGVYLQPNLKALEIVKTKGLLQKSLKTPVNEIIFLAIEQEIKENWD